MSVLEGARAGDRSATSAAGCSSRCRSRRSPRSTASRSAAAASSRSPATSATRRRTPSSASRRSTSRSSRAGAGRSGSRARSAPALAKDLILTGPHDRRRGGAAASGSSARSTRPASCSTARSRPRPSLAKKSPRRALGGEGRDEPRAAGRPRRRPLLRGDPLRRAVRDRGPEGGHARVHREARAELQGPLEHPRLRGRELARQCQTRRPPGASAAAMSHVRQPALRATERRRRRGLRRERRLRGAGRHDRAVLPARRLARADERGRRSSSAPSACVSPSSVDARPGSTVAVVDLDRQLRRRRRQHRALQRQRHRAARRRGEQEPRRPVQVRERVGRPAVVRVHLEVEVGRPVGVARVADVADRLAGDDLRAVLQARASTTRRRRTCPGCRSPSSRRCSGGCTGTSCRSRRRGRACSRRARTSSRT